MTIILIQLSFDVSLLMEELPILLSQKAKKEIACNLINAFNTGI